MRALKSLLLFVALLPLTANSQEQTRIEEIKALFSDWQPIIKAEIKKAPSVYLYAWGNNYENMDHEVDYELEFKNLACHDYLPKYP